LNANFLPDFHGCAFSAAAGVVRVSHPEGSCKRCPVVMLALCSWQRDQGS